MKDTETSDENEVGSRYSALISRLEREAEAAPASYKRRLFLLSTLGYAYPIAVLAGVLATLAGAIYLILSAPPLLIALGPERYRH